MGFSNTVLTTKAVVGQYIKIPASFPDGNYVAGGTIRSLIIVDVFASGSVPGLTWSNVDEAFYGTPTTPGIYNVSFSVRGYLPAGSVNQGTLYTGSIGGNFSVIVEADDSEPVTEVDTGEVDDDGNPITETISTMIPGELTNSFAIEVDFDIVTKQLSLPGDVALLPTTEPPVGGQNSDPAAEEYFQPLHRGERYQLAIGLSKRGVLQDIPLDNIDVTFKHFEPERTTVHLGEGDLQLTGDGLGTRRYLTTIFVDPDKVNKLVRRGTDIDRTYIDGFLQLEVEQGTDAGDYDSGNLTATRTVTGGFSSVDSFTADLSTLWDNSWPSAVFDVELSLAYATAPELNVTHNCEVQVSKSGATFQIDSVTPAAPLVTTAVSAVPADWDSTFRLDNVQALVTGFRFEGQISTTTQPIAQRVSLYMSGGSWGVEQGYDNNGNQTGDYELTDWGSGTPLELVFRDGSGNILLSWSSSASSYTAAALSSALSAALGEAVSASLSSNQITLTFGVSTTVATVEEQSYGYGYGQQSLVVVSGGPTHQGVITARITGQPQPGLQMREISHSVKVRMYRDHD